MTPEQIAALDLEYQAVAGGETLRAAILGDLSGREAFEAEMDLRGVPINVGTRLQRLLERQVYERSGVTNLLTNLTLNTLSNGLFLSEYNPLTVHANNLDAATNRAYTRYTEMMATPHELTESELQELNNLLGSAEQTLQTFREARDASAEVFANTLTTAVGVTIAIASGGTVTPLLITLATVAGATTQAGARFLIQGGAYNIEVLATDILAGGISGATSVWVPCQLGIHEPSMARFLYAAARGAINGGTIGFTHGALVSALQETTWEEGAWVGIQAVLASGAVSGTFGAVIGAGLDTLVSAIRGVPEAQPTIERDPNARTTTRRPGSTDDPFDPNGPVQRARPASNESGSAPRRSPGEPGTPEHRASRWQDYLDSFEPGGSREGRTPWTQERWNRVYDRNMSRARIAAAYEAEYHEHIGWGSRQIEVSTPDGPRVLDIADLPGMRAVEVKSGRVSMNPEIRSQIQRDAWLVLQGWDIEYHFAPGSQVAQSVLDDLQTAGIRFSGV